MRQREGKAQASVEGGEKWLKFLESQAPLSSVSKAFSAHLELLLSSVTVLRL